MSDFNSKGSMKMKRNLSFSLISKQTEEVRVLKVLLKRSKNILVVQDKPCQTVAKTSYKLGGTNLCNICYNIQLYHLNI